MSTENSRIPSPSKPYRHKMPIQLRFNDIDMFGHVNNAIYLQFFDLGKLCYFEKVLGKDFARKGFTAVVVNVNCNFYSPSFLSEELEVQSAVVAMGEKSITLEQRIENKLTGDVKCICTTVMSGFDSTTLKSAPIPSQFRDAIRDFESE